MAFGGFVERLGGTLRNDLSSTIARKRT